MAETRAKKSGIGAEIEKKVESRYDAAEAAGTPEAIRLWINATVGSDHAPIATSEFRELQRSLADGILICKLINKLLVSDGKKGVSFQKNCASPFVAMGNIESFNKGVVDYGLPKESQFQSTDLREGKKAPFLNVVNTLHNLAMKSMEKNFEVAYTGVQTEYLDNN